MSKRIEVEEVEVENSDGNRPCKCIESVTKALKEKGEILALVVPFDKKKPARCAVAKVKMGRDKGNGTILVANYCPFCGQQYEQAENKDKS